MLSDTIVHDDNNATLIRACPLLASNYAPDLYSLQDMKKEFLRVLKHHGDRLSSAEMATWLGINEDDVIIVGDEVCINSKEQQNGNCHCHYDGEEIPCKVYNPVKKRYQYAILKSLCQEVEECINCRREETLESAVPKQPSLLLDSVGQEIELTNEDVKWLSQEVASSHPTYHHHNLENQVLSSLAGVSAPTSIEQMFNVDIALILPIVKRLCDQGRLPGIKSCSSNNAMYTPHMFTCFQRDIIDSFFGTNGYITEKKVSAAGLSKNRMECFVKESFPNAVSLPHSIIDVEAICSPLELAIQSAILNVGLTDLRSLIPFDLASNYDDAEHVINHCLPNALKLQQETSTYDAFLKGVVLLNNDIAIFTSKEMSENSVNILDPMIESYAKRRAQEIVKIRGTSTSDLKDKPSVSTADDIVPLNDVANCIGKNYPDLLQLQESYQECSSCEASLSWNSEEVGKCDGPLFEFCREVIHSKIERKCTRAVKAEVAILDSALNGVSISDHVVGAVKQMDMRATFETSFKDLCYLLQILTKTIENFSSKGVFTSEEITSMRRELLSGLGSCLAKLITEHCLHKSNSEGGRDLTFLEQHHNNFSPVGTPFYVSALDSPSFSLKCNTSARGREKDPFQVLRESIQGGSGLSLVQMWELCTDEYINHADEQLSQFISHLEESCLLLIGIPFSILDKKAEKKLLTARRQGLIDRLENSSQQDEILHSCAILIYQQTRNLMLFGKTMTSLVMNLFDQEKKIPTKATEILAELKSKNDVSSELISLAKQYGMAKNSKAMFAISEANN